MKLKTRYIQITFITQHLVATRNYRVFWWTTSLVHHFTKKNLVV